MQENNTQGNTNPKLYDAIIVGGGPAGLSAALILGRCRRSVLVCDSGESRNEWSVSLNGYLTRDGIHPKEFLAIGRRELEPYGVEWKNTRVVEAACGANGWFELWTEDGEKLSAKKILIATGLKDYWPEIPGSRPFYGTSIHHCPYCDGWESRDKPLVAYGLGRVAVGLSMSLKTWSPDVTLCTDGSNRLTPEDRDKLARNSIKVRTEKITRAVGTDGHLEHLYFDKGEPIPCGALFFAMASVQRSDLPRQLNCEFTAKGVVKSDNKQKAHLTGLYLAGDADRDMQQVIVAAAEGVKAAININKELQEESYR
jgi:thioredoxin reductase